MSIDNLRFPVIAVRGPIARVYATQNDLLTCTRSALRRGWFHDLLLVDARGNGRRVREATRVGTAGPFWGIDIFLNQWLRVMLHFDGDSVVVPLPELKRYLLRAVEVAPGQWDGGRSPSELRALIAGATTRDELLRLMNRS